MSDELHGIIERVTFHNPENGFTVAKIKVKRQRDLACAVGPMPMVQPGETVCMNGQWQNHPQHGWQFLVQQTHVEAPASAEAIRKYLESNLVKGIGHVYAARIVKLFGDQTLEVIDKTPKRLLDIGGIGPKRVAQIERSWQEQRTIRDVMLFLQSYGVTPAYAQRIFKIYRQEALIKVRENPYNLARDVVGVGFKTADRIAGEMGIEKDSPRRIEAGIEFVLNELSNDGHVCYPETLFIEHAAAMLDVSATLVEERLQSLRQENRIISADLPHGQCLWRKPMFLMEQGICHEIRRLLDHPSRLRPIDGSKAVQWVQERLHLQLAQKQEQAVVQAVSKKVQIITGGPGTGKSTIIRAILTITSYLTQKIILAAPTGRAAKRMSEVTGRKAQTIHSLLEFDFKKGGFKRGSGYPLDCDLVVIDEASMIDTPLMHSLLKAIPHHARVVLVGDINQLPSVGPGNVLKDLIDSHTLPVTELTEIFRQAKGSRIIINAHRINQGEFPFMKNEDRSDFFFLEVDEPEDIRTTILGLVQKRLPQKYGLDPVQDIQVLTPMKRGIIGTEQLNITLQAHLNPSTHPLIRAGRQFHTDDKVMQIRNNYDKQVYNGDVGRIQKISLEEQQLAVDFDGHLVTYDFLDLDELVLAYAVSIHKSQGSEFPCVVMPLHTTHFKLLHRNLLYTGVTRGKKLVVLVGTKKALAIAIRNDEVLHRYTGLSQAMEQILQLNRYSYIN